MNSVTQVFLSFIDPLFESVPEDFTEADIQALVKVGFISWNAVVLEAVHGDAQFLEKIEDKHEGAELQQFQSMIQRKRELFGEHMVMLGRYEVHLQDDGQIEIEMSIVDPAYYQS